MASDDEGVEIAAKIGLPQSAMDRLERIRVMAESDSLKQVLKDAVGVYHALLKEELSGSTFYIQRPGKDVEIYQIFGVEETN